jgi:TolB protein
MNIRKLLFFFVLAAIVPIAGSAQDFILRPTPGAEIILAVADARPAQTAEAAETAEVIQTFNSVLWDDTFSGFFTMAGKSYYPPESATAQTEKDIPFDKWASLPFHVTFLSTGTLSLSNGRIQADLSLFDIDQRKKAFGLNIMGDKDQVRTLAHQWADEIVYRLTAGASRGIASTQIAYTSKRGSAKEIYIMDYDGSNVQAFTQNGSLNLFPTWSTNDNSKLAFLSQRTGKWEINIHSFVDGMRLPFPVFNTFTNSPSLSPDGRRIAFSLRTSRGDTDIFVSNLDGSDRRNITNNPAIDTSPAWSPSGKQIAFVSSRGGAAGQIYICDADGANVRRILKEGGDADSPAWSPDGRWIAFHWKPRLRSYYDLFLAEVSTDRFFQLTTDSGSNENPSWAPDGRHLAFQSNRTGGDHIYIMLLDGNSAPRMVTRQGNETGPCWSGYAQK